jgi:DNA-binding NarL/FixJ family response regulator
VAIVDISLEGGSSGIELIKHIKTAHPSVIVLVLSMHEEPLYVERALRAGARGYVMKREVTRNVLKAIRSVLEGEVYLSDNAGAAMSKAFTEDRADGPAAPVEKLSDRELEVFQLKGRGCGTRQIAQNLNVSVKTVHAFCARIKKKLNLANANEMLRAAVRWHDRAS